MKNAMQFGLKQMMGQSLTLTPQLQHAIRLLQLPTTELLREIQQTIESNPMLELSEEGDNTPSSDAEPATDITRGAELLRDAISASYNGTEDGMQGSGMQESVGDTALDLETSMEIPTELPVDSAWEDIYPNLSSPSGKQDYDVGMTIEQRQGTHTSLHDYLMWQMRLTPFSETDAAIATTLIDAINEDGMLESSAEDIALAVDAEDPPDTDDVLAVLKRIQQFDPPGIGARSVAECLLLQLMQLPEDTLYRQEAMLIIQDHLDWLVHHEHKKIQRALKLTQDSLLGTLKLLRSLNPRPGSQIAEPEANYIVPDVLVRKERNRWVVELNNETLPALRINKHYAGFVQRANKSSDNVFLRNQLQEARWFLKSLQSRNETLLKVATCIVKHQIDFLERGEEAMKPLVLRDIATDVEMHESTISRVTTQKYMHTPRGIYELKYFFSSHLATDSGIECSSTAIRALIKKLIAQEVSAKPLSDHRIAKLLGDQGIIVARRTVAKYREAMNIPPSNERKRL